MTFPQICYLIAGALLSATAFCFCALSVFGLFQQCGYKNKKFLEWFYKKGNILRQRYSLLALSLGLLTALFSLCFAFLGKEIANLFSAIPFFGICILFALSGKRALKVALVRTGRVVRLGVCFFLLTAGVVFGLSYGVWEWTEEVAILSLFRFVPVAILPVLFPLLLCLANAIMSVYELPRNRSFIKKATVALQKSSCIKVGVTGSYGKTSVKHILQTLLSEKYLTKCTPASYNTPIGVAKAVNGGALNAEVLLVEMGARKTGDILELCEMVRPDYGVITGVCGQHLQTFGSIEAIKKEKCVLAQFAPTCILGESVADASAKNAIAEGKDFLVEQVACTQNGTQFTLRFGEETLSVTCSLFGRHIAHDVAYAVALCRALGLSGEEINRGLQKLAPVPHRLQKIEANGVVILDDSYNCNIEGAKNAIEALKAFGGKKFAVTPGIVELGALEEETNGALGASLVGLDMVILVGETLVLAVKRGYLQAGGEEERLVIVPTLEKAQEVLAQTLSNGDCVLFLNDLPDIYA